MSKTPADNNITDTNLSSWQSTSSVGTDSPESSIRSFLIPLSSALASVGLFTIIIVAAVFKLTVVQKQKKKRTVADAEVHHACYENVAPIYETINSIKTDNSHTNKVGTITSDVVYEIIHSQETKCCQNVSPKIDTASNVAYITLTGEILMQNNDSYQAACTVTK